MLLFLGVEGLLRGENAFLLNAVGLLAFAGLFTAFPALISLLCSLAGKGKQYKRKSIRFHRRVLAFSFLICVALFICGMIPGARQAVNEAALRSEAEQAAKAPWSEHTFADGNFVVTTPSNWVKVEAPTLGNRGYTLVDEYHQMNVVVAATPKADVSITSLDQLHQMAIAVVKRYGSNHAAGKMRSFLHRSFPARQTNITWEDAPQKFQTATRQIEFPKHWVEIDLVASPSKFGKHEELLIRIADSIRPQ